MIAKTTISQQQLESYLWGAATLLRGTIDAGDYKQFIFPLLFYKRLCDVYDEETGNALAESGGDQDFALFPENHRFQVPVDAHWREVRKVATNVGQALQNAMRAIESANPDKLYGIFGDAQWTNKDRLPDSMLRDLIEHFSTLELTVANLPEDELGQGYEYLIKKFADDSGHTAAEFYTNRTVVHLMTELLQPQPGESIYDPTCGSGGMLLSAVTHLRRQGKEWRNVKLYGQERNLMTSSIARMNCFLHGIEDFQIVRGDTLSEPKLVEGDRLMQFDVVLANPPYSIKQWDRDAFGSDPWGRNLLGTPPQGRADYAFQQHVLKSLKAHSGRCAVLWPHGILFRNEEAEIRQKLVESDLIEAVIGLGPNLFYNSSMQSCILVCRARKPVSRRGKILFIEAVNEVGRERAQSFLTAEHIGRIVRAYNDFAEVPGFAHVACLSGVREKGYVLNIPLYVEHRTSTAATEDERDLGSSEAFREWQHSSDGVRRSLAAVIENSALITNGHLKKYQLQIPKWLNRSEWQRVRLEQVCTEISDRVDDPSSSGYERFVGLEHFDSGELKIRRWGITADLISAMKLFRSGDTLFARRNAYLKRASMVDFDGICSGDAIVLRADTAYLLPEFLPLLLNSENFWKFAIANAAGTMSRRVNSKILAGYEFDLPPINQQRRISEIVWRLDSTIQAVNKTAVSVGLFENALLEAAILSYEKHSHQKIVGELLDSSRPLCYGIVQPGNFIPNGVPFIRVCDMEGGCIQVNALQRVSVQVNHQYRRSTVRAGDVLVSVVGTIGRVAVVGPECHEFNIARAVARLAPAQTVQTEFLARILRAPSTQRRLLGDSFETARKTLNLSALEKLVIPIPSLEEQKTLLSQLDQLSETVKALRRQATSMSVFRTALCNQMVHSL